jgi:hypothetical protein
VVQLMRAGQLGVGDAAFFASLIASIMSVSAAADR